MYPNTLTHCGLVEAKEVLVEGSGYLGAANSWSPQSQSRHKEQANEGWTARYCSHSYGEQCQAMKLTLQPPSSQTRKKHSRSPPHSQAQWLSGKQNFPRFLGAVEEGRRDATSRCFSRNMASDNSSTVTFSLSWPDLHRQWGEPASSTSCEAWFEFRSWLWELCWKWAGKENLVSFGEGSLGFWAVWRPTALTSVRWVGARVFCVNDP